jgi:hypothetical protein
LRQTGQVNTTKTGANACDVFAFHPYTVCPPGLTFQTWTGDQINGACTVPALRTALTNAGFGSLPIWITEVGMDANNLSAAMIAWAAAPAATRYVWMCRHMMTFAAQGAQKLSYWEWQNSTPPSNSGNWQADTQGVVKALNDFTTYAAGRTLTAWSYIKGGPVTLAFADGTSWTV